MIIKGYISAYDGQALTVIAPFSDDGFLQNKCISECEIRLDDGRRISAEQRKKAYALIGEIARWTGYFPEEAKAWLKFYFCAESGENDFSLSNCSVTVAREFITYLVNFCLENDVPCMDRLINNAEDIGAYLYSCLIHKRCCLCGGPAELHHADGSRIGMGRNRLEIPHIGLGAYALCRKHHSEAHTLPQDEFNAKYHIYEIKIDAPIVDAYKLKKE